MASLPPNTDLYLAALRQFYGTQQDPPQVVMFTIGDCNNGKMLTTPNGVCAYGTWYGPAYPSRNVIYMMYTDDWRVTLAHEMLHQKLYERDGDADYSHMREEWRSWLPTAIKLIGGDPSMNTIMNNYG